MRKAIISLALTISAWGIGLGREWAHKNRIRRLTAFCDGLLLIEQEIGACLSPLGDAFQSAAVYDLLFEKAASFLSYMAPYDAFTKAMAEDTLDKEETEILASFAKCLNAPSEEILRQNISLCRTRLSALLATAEANAARLGHLYSIGGAICGLFVSILLL